MARFVLLLCAEEDSMHRDALVKHLTPVLHERDLKIVHVSSLRAGGHTKIAQHLDAAELTVTLISAEYLALERYRFEREAALAKGESDGRVVPVLVRPCKLPKRIEAIKYLPEGPTGRPKAVTTWSNADAAWTSVAMGIHLLLPPSPPSSRGWYESQREQIRTASRQTKRLVKDLDDATIRLLGMLEDASARRLRVREAGGDAAKINEEIRKLKQQIREGGQLRQGDLVGDRYTLLQQIGQGGFANVWEAEDRRERRRVALKVLHANLAQDPEKTERFWRGARAMRSLEHPAVVPILDERVEDGGYQCFAMELMRGGTLEKAVLEHTLPRDRLFPLLLSVCDALIFAHAKGFVHRDVKPPNILLDEGFAPRLTDFDLVFNEESTGGTRTGQAMGTFAFAAPELRTQANEADARADVFSMGVTALFCVRERKLDPRYLDRTLDALAMGTVAEVLRQAVAQEPEDRYPDMRSFRDALEMAYLQDLALVDEDSRESGPRIPGWSGHVQRPIPLPSRPFQGRGSDPNNLMPGPRPTPVSVSFVDTDPPGVDYDEKKFAGLPEIKVSPPPAAPSVSEKPELREGLTDAPLVEISGRPSSHGVGLSGRPSVQPLGVGRIARWTALIFAIACATLFIWIVSHPRNRETPPPPLPRCPEGMVGVPGGVYEIGSPLRDKDADPDDEQIHSVKLSAFCVDITEVTVEAYRRCSDEKGPSGCGPIPVTTYRTAEDRSAFWDEQCNARSRSKEKHPMNCVDWEMARRYCAFRGARLPTEAEWEVAARGADHRRYPWGADPPRPSTANVCGAECCELAAKNQQTEWVSMFANGGRDGWPATAPVGSFPEDKSSWGARDMAGNVLEWVEDWYLPYEVAEDPIPDPVRSQQGVSTTRVLRGGGWTTSQSERARAAWRSRAIPDSRAYDWGFRCAAAPLNR